MKPTSYMHRLPRFALLGSAACLVAACASAPRPSQSAGSSPPDRPYQKEFNEDASTSCKAAHRALLGDGYLLETPANDKLKGRKFYRVNNEQGNVVDITINCLANNDGTSTVYATALRSAYEMKKSSSSASVGVSVFGSLSLPIGQSADGMVKTTEETITDPAFYRDFFAALRANLEENKGDKAGNKP